MTSRSYIFFLFFVVSNYSIYSQTNNRQRLRDNQIKKISTYRIDSANATKYLSSIDFVNDSGLIIKTELYTKNGPSRHSELYTYDNRNRLITNESHYGDTTYTYNYEYLYNDVTLTTINGPGHTSTGKTKGKTKGIHKKKKSIIRYYKENKLYRVEKIKDRKNCYITTFSKKGIIFRHSFKNYFDSTHRITRSEGKGAYSKKTFNTYEYNSIGLKSKSTHYPGLTTWNSKKERKNYTTEFYYEYLKE